MKRILALVLAILSVVIFACACSDNGSDTSDRVVIKDENGSVIADTENGDEVEIDYDNGEITVTDKDGNQSVIDTNEKPTTVIKGDGDKVTSSQMSGPVVNSGAPSQGENQNSSATPQNPDTSSTAVSKQEIIGIESAEDWL